MAPDRIQKLRDRIKAQVGAQQNVLVELQSEVSAAKDAVLAPAEVAALDELDAMFPATA